MKHKGMLKFEDDDFEVAIGTTVEEIRQLAEVGFQKFDQVNSMHIFRKSKRFRA